MGTALRTLKNKLFGHKQVRIIMCGLDAAGKTSILYRIKLKEFVTTIPTMGFNVETINYKNVSFTAWDVGGGYKIRPLWRHYSQGAVAVVFVIDSNDKDRINEVKDVLWDFIILKDELKDCVLLVMANKQDLPNVLTVEEIIDRLELNKINNRSWHIQACSAVRGDGLHDGLEWLHSQLTSETGERLSIEDNH